MSPADLDPHAVPGDTPVEKAKWLANAALEEADEGNDVRPHLEGIEALLGEVTAE